jgi:hypothetical protein
MAQQYPVKEHWRNIGGALKDLLWNYSVTSLYVLGKFSVTIVKGW